MWKWQVCNTLPKLKKDRTFEYSCVKMEMLNAYSGSLKIKQWAIVKKIGSIIRRQSPLCQTLNIEIWNRAKIVVIILWWWVLVNPVHLVFCQLKPHKIMIVVVYNLDITTFSWVCFFNFKQSKRNFLYLHCLLKYGNSSTDPLAPQ